jgi:hypothetical protein
VPEEPLTSQGSVQRAPPSRRPWRRVAALVLLYAAAVSIGVGSAWFWLTRVGIAGVDAGAWRVNLLAGSGDADPYTRARIAIGAVLALDRSETLYYTTEQDDAGQPLRAECDYMIEGVPPPARWWSITAYAADNFLFPSPLRRYSIGSESPVVDARGRFATALGPTPQADASEATRIPTTGHGRMRLTLRLYGPAAAIQRDPGSLAAPVIRLRGACP